MPIHIMLFLLHHHHHGHHFLVCSQPFLTVNRFTGLVTGTLGTCQQG